MVGPGTSATSKSHPFLPKKDRHVTSGCFGVYLNLNVSMDVRCAMALSKCD